jgi:hypothetical protein
MSDVGLSVFFHKLSQGRIMAKGEGDALTTMAMNETAVEKAAAAGHTGDSISTVFATPELVYHVLQNIIDVNSLSAIPSLCLVTKQFQKTLSSDTLWRELCLQRWKHKWGFVKRWERALLELEESKHKRTMYWMHKYKSEEIDAERQLITGSELKELVFDFRYWIGNPTVRDGRIIVQSGLIESASNQLRFESNNDEQTNEWWSAQGVITGHPLRAEDEIEWFLHEESGRVQWGFVPNLWPEGRVRRLDSWGWEIRNCNVVMRAIDTDVMNNNKDEEVPLRAKEVDNQLWKDLLDDLDNIPLRNNPTVNGFLVTAEIPRTYLDQFTM